MGYLLGFDKMVSPIIIKVVYFLGLLGVLVASVLVLISGKTLVGIAILVFGALLVRIYSELLILMFRIYDNLVEINKKMKPGD